MLRDVLAGVGQHAEVKATGRRGAGAAGQLRYHGMHTRLSVHVLELVQPVSSQRTEPQSVQQSEQQSVQQFLQRSVQHLLPQAQLRFPHRRLHPLSQVIKMNSIRCQLSEHETWCLHRGKDA